MYGLNAVALLVFGMLTGAALRLRRCPAPVRQRTLRILCAVLLVGNVVRYALSPLLGHGLKIPVEFSAVAYFIVPVIALLRWRRLQCWAVYSGLMAGFFYYMAMIAAGGAIYCTYPPHDIYSSMFCHGTLYLYGMSVIATQQFSEKQAWTLALGIALVTVHALVLRPYAQNQGRLLIYTLLDAVFVERLLPESCWNVAALVYYPAMAGLLLLSVRLFFRVNHAALATKNVARACVRCRRKMGALSEAD